MHLPREFPIGLWPSIFAVQSPGGQTAAHRHHALHLVVVRCGALCASVEGSAHTAPGVLVPPHALHAIDSRGETALLLMLDPESRAGAQVCVALRGAPRWLDSRERNAVLTGLPDEPSSEDLDAWVHRALTWLAVDPTTASRPMHPKVRRTLKLLADAPLSPAPSLDAMAERVGLSPSRLMHAFAEETGTSWRIYLRWLRFQRAARAIVQGTSLSAAALEAGFVDSAHMSRTFREMYGLPPSQLRGA